MTRLLIVDDHPEIRRLLCITFGDEYDVIEAEDGASALSMAKDKHPDVILLDIMLRGFPDGLQVLDAIKADPSLTHTRIVMVTACGQVSDYEKGLQRGADDYFIKPFSPMKLVKRIRELSR